MTGNSVHRVPVCALSGFSMPFVSDEFEIWYSASSSLDLIGFSDADFAGSEIDHKSTSGICHVLGTFLICWSFQK
jgi:hypothetical protein